MREKYGVIIIDMQNGVFNLKQPVYQAQLLVENIKSQLNAARLNQITIIFTQHDNKTFLQKGSNDWEIIEELAPGTDELFVYKSSPSVFNGTDLENLLKERKINHLIISGLITNGCVQQACTEALHKDYHVTLVSDAHSTFYKKAGKVIKDWNDQIEELGATVIDTRELLDRLDNYCHFF